MSVLFGRQGRPSKLTLDSCILDNFRALRHLAMKFDETTVIVGENGCGKSSLLHALEVCLGPQAPAEGFHFEPEDFHRDETDLVTGPIRIRLTFSDADSRPAAPRSDAKAREVGTVEDRQRVCLAVQAYLKPEAIDVSYRIESAGRSSEAAADLAELRRLIPFIRIRSNRRGGESSPSTSAGVSADEIARARVQSQLNNTLAALVEVESVTEEMLAEVREAVQESMRRWALGAEADPPPDHAARVMAPLSPSGTWAQMAALMRGSGAQSLAMLAFAGAYLQARGAGTLDPDARPVVTIEEPESKLHPLMLTAVWNLIRRLPAQRIVTTNSADLLAAIPLGGLRRIVRNPSGRALAHRVPEQGMTFDELRRVAYHLRVRRGTALFMRFWLLVEGETEFWLLPEIARSMHLDLRQEGVECLEFAQSGLTPLVRLAGHLGIGWHLLADGDRAGQSYHQQAQLLADQKRGRVTVLRARDIEHCFWEQGYSHVFFAAAGIKPTRSRHTRPKAIIDQALRNYSKPELALLLSDEMRSTRSPGVPRPLEHMILGAIHWATYGSFA